MANSIDPDQMPHSGSTLFAKVYLYQYLGLLQYCEDFIEMLEVCLKEKWKKNSCISVVLNWLY